VNFLANWMMAVIQMMNPIANHIHPVVLKNTGSVAGIETNPGAQIDKAIAMIINGMVRRTIFGPEPPAFKPRGDLNFFIGIII
jgi:hypothetical protein